MYIIPTDDCQLTCELLSPQEVYMVAYIHLVASGTSLELASADSY